MSRLWQRVVAAVENPRIVIPLVLTAALLAFALSISDAGRVMRQIVAMPIGAVLATGACAAVYLALKGLVFWVLLSRLHLVTSWRALVLAYAVGELAITMPAGVYAQNYVLRRSRGTSFALSASATTAMLAIEAVIVLVALLVWGIPDWPWLRPAIGGFLVSAAVGFAVLVRVFRGWDPAAHLAGHRRLRSLAEGLVELIGGMRSLVRPGTLATSLALTSIYLGVLIAGFRFAGRGTGAEQLDFHEALTIYFFGLGIMLVFGTVLTQLGVIEVAGLGAAHAWGYTVTQALAMLLGFRIVWVASVWLVSGTAALILHRQLDPQGDRPRA